MFASLRAQPLPYIATSAVSAYYKSGLGQEQLDLKTPSTVHDNDNDHETQTKPTKPKPTLEAERNVADHPEQKLAHQIMSGSNNGQDFDCESCEEASWLGVAGECLQNERNEPYCDCPAGFTTFDDLAIGQSCNVNIELAQNTHIVSDFNSIHWVEKVTLLSSFIDIVHGLGCRTCAVPHLPPPSVQAMGFWSLFQDGPH